ncbi:MAG TPA: hypothetical protein VED40_07415 [Azospirillaceae bacterium]|nr:hypothetical protein [Azospirillaceae bacterium]
MPFDSHRHTAPSDRGLSGTLDEVRRASADLDRLGRDYRRQLDALQESDFVMHMRKLAGSIVGGR